jgi:hypothetical protein
MTLRLPTVSDDSVEAVRSRLSALAGRPAFPERALGRADPDRLALAAPHDVYVLGLDRLAAGAALVDATVVGRRFLVLDGDAPVASAEIAGDGAELQTTEGPYVLSTASAIARAEQDPELAKADYELRLLRVPALYFVGIWLKREGGAGDDVVIPLEPAPEGFVEGRAYPPAELLHLLAEQARTRLEFDDESDA